MARQFNRHQFVYPTGFDMSEPRLGYRDIDAEGGVEALLHPAVKSGAHLPPHVAFGHDERSSDIGPGQAQRDLERAEAMAAAERGEMEYDGGGAFMDAMRAGGMAYDQGGGTGATRPTPIHGRAQAYLDARAKERVQRPAKVEDAYAYGQQYLNNPFDAKGRKRMGQQFMEAPLGGHVRRGLEGQELFGNKITAEQALYAERGLAGLTAVGVGVPAFLAAVNQLSTPQDQNTIPL